MASISLIVKVTITKGTRTVSLQAFNIPAILGPSNRFADPFKIYVDPADMISDGFLVSDPEYIHAVELTEQAIVPDEFVVSKFTAAVAQIDTFSVSTLASGHQYKFTLNSIVVSYTSLVGDAQQDILAGLLAALAAAFPTNPPVSGAVTGTGSGALLTLTATVAGVGASYTAIDADLAHLNPVANHTIVQDIQTLQNFNTGFYGLLVTSKIKSDIEQIAAYVESQLLIYIAATQDSDVLTTSTTDIASILKGFAYTRTGLLYSAMATSGADAAWMGYMLPTTPGVGNWKFKTLVGITPDNLNSTQIFNAQNKRCNVYVEIGGVGVTLEGITPAGEFIDVTIFIDWLSSTVQSNVFNVLTNPANLKIPYTNKGIAAIENPIHQALQQGEDNDGLAPGWTVFAPDVVKVSQADKANRTLNNTGFNAELAGAINKVNIQGFVSV